MAAVPRPTALCLEPVDTCCGGAPVPPGPAPLSPRPSSPVNPTPSPPQRDPPADDDAEMVMTLSSPVLSSGAARVHRSRACPVVAGPASQSLPLNSEPAPRHEETSEASVPLLWLTERTDALFTVGAASLQLPPPNPVTLMQPFR
ncbi:uncharacterized protein LOC126471226 [Schistocerca serialis cubense]|uniref:uncharacterized protein LOC126471226 n=1 Tax=Schistocerca serialis cubense TaxID=2023355 RepID=UPI00214E559E|nr:uncharacterized protein LOC126471226 [Schistocerca serialis cubense]